MLNPLSVMPHYKALFVLKSIFPQELFSLAVLDHSFHSLLFSLREFFLLFVGYFKIKGYFT